MVLIFSLLIVYLFNTISPSTSRSNYTLAVLIVSTLRAFFHNAVSQTWNLGPVLWTALYLLIPAYSVFLIRWSFSFLKTTYQRRNALNPKDFESGLNKLQKSFRDLMAKAYGELSSSDSKKPLDRSLLKEQVEELERSIQGLKTLIDSKKE
ncbi:hypothetical protein EHQ67_17375 [Leptospira kmetyi]|nr:hypothetical protein EHQ67_17375 [Leptospira kmetyi]